MEHHFTGPPFTLGVEEELMIVDASTIKIKMNGFTTPPETPQSLNLRI